MEKILNFVKTHKILSIIILAVIVIIIAVCVLPVTIEHAKLTHVIKEKATEAGLEDVSVSLRRDKYHDIKVDYVTVKCSNFEDLPPSEMLEVAWSFDTSNGGGDAIAELSYIESNGKKYTFDNDNGNKTLYCDGESISFLGRPNYSSSSSSSSSSSKKKCPSCNGTGSVKYYYGESAWEAAINGQNDYEFGPCYTCHGTGYVN